MADRSSARYFVFGHYRLDRVEGRLWRGTTVISLTRKAHAALSHLVANAGRLVTKESLLTTVWPRSVVVESVLTTVVRELRRALEDPVRSPRFIQTAHGQGYRFIAPVTACEVLPPVSEVGASTLLVGRETESRQLQDSFAACFNGSRQIVFLAGEAGIGKTAIIDEFIAHVAAASTVTFMRGQCIEHYGMGEAYLPILEALDRLGRDDDLPLRDVLSRCAPSWLAHLPGLQAASAAASTPVTPARMLRELSEALERLAEHKPIVFVLEDLHWCDTATLDWLAHFARRRDAARIIVLATYRPIEVIVHAHPLRAIAGELQRQGRCVQVTPDYLTRPVLEEYLRRRFPDLAETPDLAELLHRRTGGQPLFFVTLVEALLNQQRLRIEGSSWRLHGTLADIAAVLPSTVSQLVEREIDTLPENNQMILEVASVAGESFSIPLLAAASGIDEAQVEKCCEQWMRQRRFLLPASDADVVGRGGEHGRRSNFRSVDDGPSGATVEEMLSGRTDEHAPHDGTRQGKPHSRTETGTSHGRTDEDTPRGRTQGGRPHSRTWDGTTHGAHPWTHVRFRHAVFQDAVYSRIPAGRRARWHRAIGEALVAAHGTDTASIAAEAAMHFERGGELPAAVSYLEQASQRSIQLSAYGEALAHARKALDLLQRCPQSIESLRQHARVQSCVATALMTTKGWADTEVEEAHLQARALCERAGDTSREISALWGLLVVSVVRSNLERTRTLSEQLLALTREQHQVPFQLAGHMELAGAAFGAGDLRLADMEFARGDALYSPSQHDEHIARVGSDQGVFLRAWRSHVAWHLGEEERALSLSEDALSLSRSFGHPLTRAIALAYAAVLHQFRRDVAQSAKFATETLALCTEHGFAYYKTWAQIVASWCQAQTEDPASGATTIAGSVQKIYACVQELLAARARRCLPYFHGLLAEAHLQHGDSTRAAAELDRGIELVSASGERWWASELWRLKGVVALRQQHPDASQAQELFKSALALAESCGSPPLVERVAFYFRST